MGGEGGGLGWGGGVNTAVSEEAPYRKNRTRPLESIDSGARLV